MCLCLSGYALTRALECVCVHASVPAGIVRKGEGQTEGKGEGGGKKRDRGEIR